MAGEWRQKPVRRDVLSDGSHEKGNKAARLRRKVEAERRQYGSTASPFVYNRYGGPRRLVWTVALQNIHRFVLKGAKRNEKTC